MDYSFETDLRVTYRDVDMQKVVHNSHYLQYAEIARIEYLRERGMRYQEMVRKYYLEMVLAESHCYYKKPAHFDDLLTIRTAIREPGRSSFKIAYQIYRKSTDDIIADIVTHHVCVDRDTFQPVSIPNEVRAIFEGQN